MWNKVNEKQPDKEGDYLVCIEHYSILDKYFRTREVARYFPKSHFQFFGKAYKQENKFKNEDGLKITNWQDLPELPKKEK